MKPSEMYRDLIQQPGFVPDPAQQHSVGLLDELYSRVCDERPVLWWQRVFSPRGTHQPLKGLYFWGGVGRGKTLLMDLFYQALPERVSAERVHFHHFMNDIHEALRELGDVELPLRKVARSIAARARVLCLDEFVIIDIGDAMIMAGLLEALFAEGVVLVTTSNARPDDLYRGGLQRARFLPAIEMIKRQCDVVNLDGEEDYRLRFLSQTDLYSVPHDAEAERRIREYIEQHVAPVQTQPPALVVNGRELAHHFCAEDTVWFSFAQLCETTRSQNDYIELARLFNTLILTDIRQMQSADDDVARRFVLLIDVLYGRHVKLICTAAVDPEQLYLGKRLEFEFQRTSSRLNEMQSEEYLAQAHTQQ